MMLGPPEEMQKEMAITGMIGGIQRLETQGQDQLLVRTSNGEQVLLQRYAKEPPSSVTDNFFN